MINKKRSYNKKSLKKSYQGGYSEKVTKLLLKSKDKKSRKAAKETKTQDLKCPKGQIKRRAYIRTDKKTRKKTAVGAKCIKDLGKEGKGPRKILLNNDGDLGRYGYIDIKNLSKNDREKALKEAVKAYGYVYVIRRVGALASLNIRTHPELSKKFRLDQKMVSKWYNKAKKEGLPPTPR